MEFLKIIISLSFLFIEISSQMIGIDMGTEFFKVCITLPHQSKYHMVENLQSKTKTNTAIFLKGTDRIYESEVLIKKLKNPKNSFTYLSPYLSITKNSSFIQDYFEKYFFNYDYSFDNKTSAINFKVKFINEEEKTEETNFPLEVIYGMLFRYIKKISEKYYIENFNENSDNRFFTGKGKIEYCFVTIPSFYTYKQKLAIIHAVTLSNLQLVGLINDNTAAALYYYKRNFDIKNYKLKNENQTVNFIYINIGSSYTQLSLVSYSKQDMKIVGEVWDKDLGGHLFTRNLAIKIMQKVGIIKEGEKPDINTYNKIYPHAYKYKENLSANKEVHMNFVIDNKNYHGVITRDEFNEVNKEEFKKISSLLDQLFKQTNMTIPDIKQFELIGGSIRIPQIQNTIKEYLDEENNDLVGTHLNGDDSIATGAAYAIRWRRKPIGDGNHFNISMDLYSKDGKTKLNRTVIFEKGTPYESEKRIGVVTDQNINLDIYEKDTKLFSCSFNTIKSNVKEFEKTVIMAKNATYSKVPKIAFEFYYSKLGIISLNAQIIFNVRTYTGLNITNNTGTIYNSVDYIEPLSPKEINETKNKLNETLNPNITYNEKDLLNKKLKIGTFVDKDIPIKLDFDIIDNEPKSFTEDDLKYWKKKLDFYDKREKDEIKIIELRNEIESLIYAKQNFLESNDVKHYIKDTEYSSLEKLVKDTKDWFEDEGSIIRNISLLSEKIDTINNVFGEIDNRINTKKERDLALEKINVQIKNNQKNYEKQLKNNKPWTEYFYDDQYLPRVKNISSYLEEKINAQNKLKSFEDSVLHKEEIEKLHQEINDLYEQMEKIPCPIHSPKYENIKIEELYKYVDLDSENKQKENKDKLDENKDDSKILV